MPVQRTTTRLAALAPAIGAAVLASGAWLMPASLFTPEVPDLTETLKLPPPVETKPAQAQAQPWTPVAEKLANLREPWKAPVGDQPDQKAAVEPQLLGWKFVGLIQSSSGERTAILAMAGTQRFVNRGETFKDPGNPAQDVTCTEITPERVSLRIERKTFNLDREPLPPIGIAGLPGEPRVPGAAGTLPGAQPGIAGEHAPGPGSAATAPNSRIAPPGGPLSPTTSPTPGGTPYKPGPRSPVAPRPTPATPPGSPATPRK